MHLTVCLVFLLSLPCLQCSRISLAVTPLAVTSSKDSHPFLDAGNTTESMFAATHREVTVSLLMPEEECPQPKVYAALSQGVIVSAQNLWTSFKFQEVSDEQAEDECEIIFGVLQGFEKSGDDWALQTAKAKFASFLPTPLINDLTTTVGAAVSNVQDDEQDLSDDDAEILSIIQTMKHTLVENYRKLMKSDIPLESITANERLMFMYFGLIRSSASSLGLYDGSTNSQSAEGKKLMGILSYLVQFPEKETHIWDPSSDELICGTLLRLSLYTVAEQIVTAIINGCKARTEPGEKLEECDETMKMLEEERLPPEEELLGEWRLDVYGSEQDGEAGKSLMYPFTYPKLRNHCPKFPTASEIRRRLLSFATAFRRKVEAGSLMKIVKRMLFDALTEVKEAWVAISLAAPRTDSKELPHGRSLGDLHGLTQIRIQEAYNGDILKDDNSEVLYFYDKRDKLIIAAFSVMKKKTFTKKKMWLVISGADLHYPLLAEAKSMSALEHSISDGHFAMLEELMDRDGIEQNGAEMKVTWQDGDRRTYEWLPPRTYDIFDGIVLKFRARAALAHAKDNWQAGQLLAAEKWRLSHCECAPGRIPYMDSTANTTGVTGQNVNYKRLRRYWLCMAGRFDEFHGNK